jgi:hypothetical protein
VQALSPGAVQSDIRVRKDITDEVVHCRLFKLAFIVLATECRRSLDLFLQEIVNVWHTWSIIEG